MVSRKEEKETPTKSKRTDRCDIYHRMVGTVRSPKMSELVLRGTEMVSCLWCFVPWPPPLPPFASLPSLGLGGRISTEKLQGVSVTCLPRSSHKSTL